MNGRERTIFGLVAQGKITAGEAERLLAASSAERESAWIAGMALALSLVSQANWLAGAARWIEAWTPALIGLSHHLGGLALQIWGGMQ